MDLLLVFASVRRQTTLRPKGRTSKARFAVRFSIAPNAAPIAVVPGAARQENDHARVLFGHMARGGAGQ